MSNQIDKFSFQDKELRVFGTDEKPMFLAKEVGEILGIKNIRQLDFEPYEIRVCSIYTNRGSREATLLSESAVYKVIFKSRKEDAKIFQKWVCEEVLPSIRRNGKYELEQKLYEMEQRKDELQQRKNELQKEIGNLQYIQKRQLQKNYTRIKLTDRLVFMGIISEENLKKLMRKQITQDGRFVMELRDKFIFVGRVMNISKRLSKRKKEIDKIYPRMERTDRSNIYTETDYLNFGDDVINEYMIEHPLDTWNIDWDYLNRMS